MVAGRAGRVAALLVAGTLAAQSAGAQTVARSFEELGSALRTGDLVVVTAADGRTLKGEVGSVSSGMLVLVQRDPIGVPRRTTFAAPDVSRVRRTDRLWNGLLIGAGVGAAATLGATRWACGTGDNECSANAGLAIGFVFVPAAAAVGVALDALVGRREVYRAPDRAPVTR